MALIQMNVYGPGQGNRTNQCDWNGKEISRHHAPALSTEADIFSILCTGTVPSRKCGNKIRAHPYAKEPTPMFVFCLPGCRVRGRRPPVHHLQFGPRWRDALLPITVIDRVPRVSRAPEERERGRRGHQTCASGPKAGLPFPFYFAQITRRPARESKQLPGGPTRLAQCTPT